VFVRADFDILGGKLLYFFQKLLIFLVAFAYQIGHHVGQFWITPKEA
jgi:hypothetical protein